jgi:pre-60S factor REI1
MNIKHGFFISEEKYIDDKDGLIKYLAGKINKGLYCLYCENKGFHDFKSAAAVKSHMIDKSHCFMKTDNFDEYLRFYDFTP